MIVGFVFFAAILAPFVGCPQNKQADAADNQKYNDTNSDLDIKEAAPSKPKKYVARKAQHKDD